jgi:hypothetical protein
MASDAKDEADREEALARREHEIEDWLHRAARVSRHPDRVHERADQISRNANRHQQVASRLRQRFRD